MITYKMHLIRTGATSEEQGPRYVGQSDPPLCAAGVEALTYLRRRARYPAAEMLFTSPLQRCVQTAELLYPNLYTESMPGLMDMHLGRFQGKSLQELEADPKFSAWLENSLDNPPPGGEGIQEFQLRLVETVWKIFQRMMEEKMRSVVLVTHRGVIMTLLAGIGLPKRPVQDWITPNGAGYTLLFTPQMWMRDRCAEIFAPLPDMPEQQEEDLPWGNGI